MSEQSLLWRSAFRERDPCLRYIHPGPMGTPAKPFIPARNEWVKVDPHSSPFPIHLTSPGLYTKVPLLRLMLFSLLTSLYLSITDVSICSSSSCTGAGSGVTLLAGCSGCSTYTEATLLGTSGTSRCTNFTLFFGMGQIYSHEHKIRNYRQQFLILKGENLKMRCYVHKTS